MTVTAKQVKLSFFFSCKAFETRIPLHGLNPLFNTLFPKYSCRSLYKHEVLASIWLNQMFFLRSVLQALCHWQLLEICSWVLMVHGQCSQVNPVWAKGVVPLLCSEKHQKLYPELLAPSQSENSHLKAWWYLLAIPSCFHCCFCYIQDATSHV